MNNYEAHKDLRRYLDAQADIRNLKEIIKRKELALNKSSGGIILQSCSSSSLVLSDRISDYLDWEKKLIEKLHEADEIMHELYRRIMKLEKKIEQDVLVAKYLSGNKVEKIAKDSNYSLSHIKRIISESLNHYMISWKKDDT